MIRMGSGLRRFALVLIGCCFCLSGRQVIQFTGQAPAGQASSQPPRTITGSVVNSVTGEPIRRALVRINGPGQSFAFTGADGRFQIENVPGGNAFLTVTAQKPGFFDPSQMGGSSAPVTLQPGSNEVLVKLNPQAGIQGRILDGDGEPIEGIQVQLMAQQIANGRKEWQPREATQTRDNGTYRIDNLMPGTYLVHTMVRGEFQYQSGQQAGNLVQQAYPERFYPNSPDMVTAQPMDLKPGEQAQADFTLSPVRAFSVSGAVIPHERGFVNIQSANGEQTWSPIMTGVRSGGRFRLTTVPSGTWILSFHSQDGQKAYGEQLITVASSDLEGIQVQLQSLASIPIDVVGGPDAASMPVQVQLVSKEKQWNNGRYVSSFMQPGNPQQSLRIDNVPPGRYTVIAQPNGPGCIDSVSSGSIDLTRDDLTVSSDSQPPINVKLREDCPTISGTVHAETGGARGFVILLPGAGSVEPKIAPVQPDGHFEFGSLSPGEYRVYAFSNIDGLEYANPEALRDLSGQQIELQPNQKVNVNLDLVVRGNS